MRPARLAFLLALSLAALSPGVAGAQTTWLCHPGRAADPCTPSLSTTLFRGWSTRVGRISPVRETAPRADCFYVYPTTSDQQTVNANHRVDPELRSIALFQAARYSQVCRVFAPVYRQITVPALGRGEYTPAAAGVAYADMLAAWRDYLAHDNHGRPFVLIGHSQGAGHLQRLVREQIDLHPSVKRRMLSAILLGGNVTVRRGSDTGGSFRTVRACRSATQLRCVIAFSSYNATPPTNAIFGRSAGRIGGGPQGSGYTVLCTNPARLAGGAAPLDSILPTAPFAPGTLIAAGISLLGLEFPKASTTFLETRGAFSGQCVRENGATVLKVRSLGSTPVPKASPDATWGLHLVDANIALGDLVGIVKAETGAYVRAQ